MADDPQQTENEALERLLLLRELEAMQTDTPGQEVRKTADGQVKQMVSMKGPKWLHAPPRAVGRAAVGIAASVPDAASAAAQFGAQAVTEAVPGLVTDLWSAPERAAIVAEAMVPQALQTGRNLPDALRREEIRRRLMLDAGEEPPEWEYNTSPMQSIKRKAAAIAGVTDQYKGPLHSAADAFSAVMEHAADEIRTMNDSELLKRVYNIDPNLSLKEKVSMPGWWLEDFVESGSTAIAFLIPGMSAAKAARLAGASRASAAALGGRISGAMGMVAETGFYYDSAMEDYIAMGFSEEESRHLASRGAVVYGLVAGIVERGIVPKQLQFMDTPGIRGWVMRIFAGGTGEVAEEELQMFLEGATRYINGLDPNLSLEGFAEAGLTAFGPGSALSARPAIRPQADVEAQKSYEMEWERRHRGKLTPDNLMPGDTIRVTDEALKESSGGGTLTVLKTNKGGLRNVFQGEILVADEDGKRRWTTRDNIQARLDEGAAKLEPYKPLAQEETAETKPDAARPLVTPAVQVEGQIFEAAAHPIAFQRAADALSDGDTGALIGRTSPENLDGFVTRDGKFISREEATALLRDESEKTGKDIPTLRAEQQRETMAAEAAKAEPTRLVNEVGRPTIGPKTRAKLREGAEKQGWNAHFTNQVERALAGLPEGMRDAIEANPDKLLLVRVQKLEDIPESLRKHYERSDAITVNNERIEFVSEGEHGPVPSRRLLQHELVHLYIDDFRKNKRSTPMFVEAQNRARELGSRVMQVVLDKRTKQKTAPVGYDKEGAGHGDAVWRGAREIRKLYERHRQMAKISPQRAAESLKEELQRVYEHGVPVASAVLERAGIDPDSVDGQYLATAIYTTLAERIDQANLGGTELREAMSEFTEDELMAYTAQVDDEFAHRLFQSLTDKDTPWTATPVDPSPAMDDSEGADTEFTRTKPTVAPAPVSDDGPGKTVPPVVVPPDVPTPREARQFDDGFTLPSETWRQRVARWFADRYWRLGTVQKAIGKQGGIVGDALGGADAVRAMTLLPGRTTGQRERVFRKYVKPLRRRARRAHAKNGVTDQDINEYLIAKFAPDRNALIAKRREGEGISPDDQWAAGDEAIPGSGMSNQQAAEVLERLESEGKTAELEKLAALVYKMNRATADLQVEYGLITKQERSDWRVAQGPRYVPLRTDMQDDGMPVARPGVGISIRGKESQAATGRTSMPDEPLIFSVMQLQEAIIRGEKNQVGQELYRMLEDNPAPDLWQLNRSERRPVLDKNTGRVRHVPLDVKDHPNVVVVKIDGIEHTITFLNEAQSLGAALKNMGQDGASKFIRFLGATNRFLAAVRTSWNPEFIITNFIRDIQTGFLNLTAEQSAAMAAEVVWNTGKAFRGSLRAIREQGRVSHKRKKPGYWDRMFFEFSEQGGRTGWAEAQSIEQRAEDFAQSMSDATPSNPRRVFLALRGAAGMLPDLNMAAENAARLSAYEALRRRGVPKAEAARVAKELTINFNRRGEAMHGINAAYMFANAGVQGGLRVLKASVTTSKGRTMSAALTVMGFNLAMLNRALSDEDDEGNLEWDKIAQHVKERYILVGIPGSGGTYLSIPAPYGYSVFNSLGVELEAMVFGGQSLEKTLTNLAVAVLGSFNPFGSDEAIVQQVSPTLVDPVVQIATNKNWYGAPIAPEQSPYGPPRPRSELYWHNVNPVSKEITRALNEAFGGDEVTIGHMPLVGRTDMSPEVLDLLGDFVGGGVGKTGKNVTVSLDKAIKGEKLPLRNIPFLRTLIRQPYEFNVARDFYYNVGEVDYHWSRLQYYSAQLDHEKRSKLFSEVRPIIAMRQFMKRQENRIAELREKKKNATSEKARKLLDMQSRRIMVATNKRYQQMTEAAERRRVPQ